MTNQQTQYSYDELPNNIQRLVDGFYLEHGYIEYINDDDLFNSSGLLVYTENDNHNKLIK